MELFDDDGYPSDEVLTHIEEWSHRKGFIDLFNLIKQLWRYPEYFRAVRRKDNSIAYMMSTGGWSGNEDIIQAMQHNTLLWTICYHSNVKGGHWQFRVNK